MAKFIPWSSQPFSEWARNHAPGKFLELNGHPTHYVEKGEGEPVILIHGYAADSYSWSKNIGALAKHFKVYALDLWGFGYSTRKPLDYSYSLYAEQLCLFMDALKIEKSSLIGQSMGGGTCIFFCVRHRNRVSKMVLVSPAGMPNPPILAQRIMMIPRVGEALLNLKTDYIRKLMIRTAFVRDKNPMTQDYFDNLTRFHKIKRTNEVLLKTLRLRFFDTLLDEIHKLSEMNVPILIAWGRQDRTIPFERGQKMHQILKTSKLEVFEKSGHVCHDEHPERFNQIAIDFLSSGWEF